MIINQTEKKNFYDALALFQNSFRSYILKSLKDKYGDGWLNKFKESLSTQQVNNWERSLQKNSGPESLIDFHHFKSFALKNRDLTVRTFENKTYDLPTWLGEIADVRHMIAHFQEVSRDEATKAWIHMRTIARIIGESELELTLQRLEQNSAAYKPKSARRKSNSDFPSFLTSTVARFPKLGLLARSGEYYRVMNSGLHGSIWVKERRNDYLIETTGETASCLDPIIIRQFGENNTENNKGYKIWFVERHEDVEKVLEMYSNI